MLENGVLATQTELDQNPTFRAQRYYFRFARYPILKPGEPSRIVRRIVRSKTLIYRSLSYALFCSMFSGTKQTATLSHTAFAETFLGRITEFLRERPAYLKVRAQRFELVQ